MIGEVVLQLVEFATIVSWILRWTVEICLGAGVRSGGIHHSTLEDAALLLLLLALVIVVTVEVCE